MFYAIRNKKTKKYITGTDYRYFPHHQRTNPYLPPLLFTEFNLCSEIDHRMISSRYYEVVIIGINAITTISLTPDNIQKFKDMRDTWLKSPD